MNTCKECIHFDVCSAERIAIGMSGLCLNFKDKAKFIELPCKIGQKIYIPHCGIDPDTEEDYYGIAELKFRVDVGCTRGAKFFITREEAEKELKKQMKFYHIK